MILGPDQRKKLFAQARALGLDGSLFQNEMDVSAKMVKATIDTMHEKHNTYLGEFNRHRDAVTDILAEMGRTGVT